MKVFFNISSRSDEKTKQNSDKIYNLILSSKNSHVYDYREDDIKFNSKEDEDEEKFSALYQKVIKSLRSSDVVILEISTNSFTQGYILQRALDMGKPVIALHQKGKYSIFVKGIKSTMLQIIEYDDYSLGFSLKEALRFAEENLISKFNFYLSADINNYLTWVSKNRNLPKSTFLRELIRSRMSQDQEYVQ